MTDEMRNAENPVTVEELIEILKDCPPNDIVKISLHTLDGLVHDVDFVEAYGRYKGVTYLNVKIPNRLVP